MYHIQPVNVVLMLVYCWATIECHRLGPGAAVTEIDEDLAERNGYKPNLDDSQYIAPTDLLLLEREVSTSASM